MQTGRDSIMVPKDTTVLRFRCVPLNSNWQKAYAVLHFLQPVWLKTVFGASQE